MDRDEVIKWRKAERQRLIGERLAIPGDIRRHQTDQIAANLDEVIGEVHGRVVSAYWPFRGEPDCVVSWVEFGGAPDDVPCLWS